MKEEEYLLKVEKLEIRKGDIPILTELSFEIKKGQQLAIVGAAGSGKTTVALALMGRVHHSGDVLLAGTFRGRISWIEQQHHFKNLSNTSDFYYQQRFNASDSEDAITVTAYLGKETGQKKRIVDDMQITYLLDEPLIQLSNGENKKVQVAKALLSNPAVLVMDQPFVGLDKTTRIYLHELLNKLAAEGKLIILVTQPDEIPACITHVIFLEKNKTPLFEPIQSFDKHISISTKKLKNEYFDEEAIKKICSNHSILDFATAIRMQKVHVRYGNKQILSGIDWEVKKGERWLLSGRNGAGKSTLLSLVTADNPQAYANDIFLFDKKRGTGESIWDIKRKIGFLSPELHIFFDKAATVFETVASGLFDTIGLFRQLSEKQMEVIREWMKAMRIDGISRKRLFEISAGEQRKVLLARAIVKNPPLLILDEPCQGLDDDTENELLELINLVCVAGDKTLVFVTHYPDKRPACVDRFIQLDKGLISGKGLFDQ